MISVGLGTLRLAPQVFWAMTPRELAAVLRPRQAPHQLPSAPTRAELDRLMQSYPDY